MENYGVSRLVRPVTLLIVMSCLFFTVMQVMGNGFSPSDDAFRHVGKVFSDKDWSEILVVDPQFSMDSHPGWHSILSGVQKLTGFDSVMLLDFSVVFLFMLFALSAVLLLKRPESWIIAFLIMVMVNFGAIVRILYGRPFIFSMFLIVLFCLLWQRLDNKTPAIGSLITLTLVSALATWAHGTWYLFALPLAALFLCARWWALAWCSAAMGLGVLLGALLTGKPFAFIHQMFLHVWKAMGSHDLQKQLVTEFWSFDGAVLSVLTVILLLIWRKARGDWQTSCVYNPVFVLAFIGWMMGFIAVRFWSDWGTPALMVWITIEIQRVIAQELEEHDIRRWVLTIVVCLALFLSFSNDRGGRWSNTALGAKWPDMHDPEHRPWLPDDGAILYNDSMVLFFRTFFYNPQGGWRYVLGFEPVWMPADDLEIYRKIQLASGSNDSYTPWVEKMQPGDRMVLLRNGRPGIEGLVWHEITPTVWSGRLLTEEEQAELEADSLE